MSDPRTWHGSKWVRYSTRLAVYLRDGLACVWCLRGVEQGAQLTLDHYVPASRGGSNNPRNLLTCCFECNRQRCAKSAALFAREEWELLAADVLRAINNKRRRRLPRERARELLRERGGTVARVLAA